MRGLLAVLLLVPGIAAAQMPALPAPRPAAPAADPALRDIRVQVVAETFTTLGAPMAGRLVEFPLRDGDRFAKDQVIARFACGERDSALIRAKAVLDLKRRVFGTKAQLRSMGTSSGLEYDIAAAEVQEATADLATAQVLATHCTVTAPFAGRVAGIAARNFQSLALGAPLIDILSDRALEVEMILPSRWLAWLKPGAPLEVAIDETGHSYAAEIIRISGRVDPVSRSIKTYARITGAAEDLLPGMSGRALLSPPVAER
jgi:RND family efflux transporter MFP subunit